MASFPEIVTFKRKWNTKGQHNIWLEFKLNTTDFTVQIMKGGFFLDREMGVRDDDKHKLYDKYCGLDRRKVNGEIKDFYFILNDTDFMPLNDFKLMIGKLQIDDSWKASIYGEEWTYARLKREISDRASKYANYTRGDVLMSAIRKAKPDQYPAVIAFLNGDTSDSNFIKASDWLLSCNNEERQFAFEAALESKTKQEGYSIGILLDTFNKAVQPDLAIKSCEEGVRPTELESSEDGFDCL